MKLSQVKNAHVQLLAYICRFKLEAGPIGLLKSMLTIYDGSLCEAK